MSGANRKQAMKTFMGPILCIAALLPGLAEADGVAPLPGDGKLVYLRQAGQGCVLELWDSKDESTHDLTTLAECPKNIDVTSEGKALVLLDKADIRVFGLPDGKLGEPIALPAMEAPKGTFGVGSALAGYTPDGVMALDMAAEYGDGSREAFLFTRKDDAWVQAEHVGCDRFSDCSFKQKFDARGLRGPAGPTEIWDDALRGDPYVVKRVPETSETRTADFDGENALMFHVYGRYSKLVFSEESGEDTDGTYTFRLSLVTPDDRTITITNHQFDATIVGHYLLFYGFFRDGRRLYDVGNGKVVLDNLTVAGWLP